MCVRGFSEIQRVLQRVKSPDVQVFVVWMPCIQSDSREAAHSRSATFKDSRVKYYWDPERKSGISWQKTLELESFAWDVYFLYGRDAKWTEDAPKPDFWMHQFHPAEGKAPFLDPAELEARITSLLAGVKQ